jgi:uncharacterized coiled-coil protein SlyX
MNGNLMELWGRTMLAAFQGQSQMDMMTSWFHRACQDMTRMNATFFQFLGLPAASSPQDEVTNQWEKAWAPLLQFQQLSLRWIGMAPYDQLATQSKKIETLEEQVKEHAQAIKKLQHLISRSGPGNNELTDQFQKLIDQQSRQFKQLTTSVGEYIKSSASDAISKKSAGEKEE